MNSNIIQTVDTFSVFVGIIGVIIIIVGVVRGFMRFVSLELGNKKKHLSHDGIRYKLGIYLLLGLEFLIAADIIETVFRPSMEQLGILAGIVFIRTVLNYFLNKELEHIKKEIK